ncbi:MAG: hypothetical protein Q4G41_07750, partial [Coriobacteriales bacterium]|nr:hypothetical protein [Coriobacteriales bacterium]
MKVRLWLKGLLASIVVALMLYATGILCMGIGSVLVVDRSQAISLSQLDTIDASMNNVLEAEIRGLKHFESNTAKDLELRKALLQPFVDGDEYTGPSSLEEGAVVRLDGGSISF